MKVNETQESFNYPKDKLVYLSADADETLTELKEDEMYIIGGIVDRNRYKNLTSDKATSLGIRKAKSVCMLTVRNRLPLDLVQFHGSRVLTVNNGKH